MSFTILNPIRSQLISNNNILRSLVPAIVQKPQSHISCQIRTATKKAGGSSNNGRDSAGRRLGIKAHGNTFVTAGSIIARQRGKKWYPGENVGMGKDHTLFAKVDGIVTFSSHPVKKKKVANVVVAP
jgi:ribosomal protein L27